MSVFVCVVRRHTHITVCLVMYCNKLLDAKICQKIAVACMHTTSAVTVLIWRPLVVMVAN